MMGGEIGVQSSAGQGSEFWFTVRFGLQKTISKENFARIAVASVVSEEVPKSAPAIPDFTHRKARILLAEDNTVNQIVALGILKKLGFRTDAVANGLEAIEALKSFPYDLVLMDMQMPEMDGMEATRQIRNPRTQCPNPNIPIIALTANAMQEDRDKCLEAGMNDYISKPVILMALAQVIEKWL